MQPVPSIEDLTAQMAGGSPAARPRLDPADIFAGAGKASAPLTMEQRHDHPGFRPRAHTEVVGTNGQLLTDDPGAKVIAFVRPNHHWGGIPAGQRVVVTLAEFEGHQECLCSPQEWAHMSAIASSVEHQAFQRALDDRRAANMDAFYRSLSQEQRAKLEEARAAARADDEREQRLRQEIAAAQAKTPIPVPERPTPATAQELDALIAQRRQATEQAAAGATARVAERLRAVFAEEEQELRAAFAAQQARLAAAQAEVARKNARQDGNRYATGPAAASEWQERPSVPQPVGPGGLPQIIADGERAEARAGRKARLAEIKDLHEAGFLPREAYEQRVAQILAEV